MTVAAVYDGQPLYRMNSGTIRTAYGFERLCRTEAEGWQIVARTLVEWQARLQQHLDDAVAKAAAGAVQTVPA